MQASASCERLVLSWWADAVRLRIDGVLVHEGDLFDTRCRWLLPEDWRDRSGLRIQLDLRSPCHDDGALIHSALVQEPLIATATRIGRCFLKPWSCPGQEESRFRMLCCLATRWHQRPLPWLIATWRPALSQWVWCIGWAMPISISPGFGPWLTPGKRRNAPFALLSI